MEVDHLEGEEIPLTKQKEGGRIRGVLELSVTNKICEFYVLGFFLFLVQRSKVVFSHL